MLCVVAPSSQKSYLDYTFSVIFDEWLGLDYQVAYTSIDNIEIRLSSEDDGAINFDTSFLNVLTRDSLSETALMQFSYNTLRYTPYESLVGSLRLNKLEQDDVPVFFGKANISVGPKITVEFDLFGTIFFMLSRFEELLNPVRDKHNRFPARESLAYKHSFLERPIVDEYVEILWACLKKLWPNLERKKHEPEMFVSCDVDIPFDPSARSIYQLVRTCFADLVKRRSPATAIRRLRCYICNKKGDFRFDPNYTFDFYMDACEQAGLKAAFYFIPTSAEPGNGCYELNDPAIRDLLKKIDQRGHEIGVHGSYQTYQDGEKLIKQKQVLDEALVGLNIKQKVRGNRQHYLRWDSEVTPDLLDAAGFQYDSTGGYADHAGFRFGTCHEFSMWSWAKKKKLNLKQRPLVVMECSVIDAQYMGLGNGRDARAFMDFLKFTCVLQRGSFTLLWHNSSLASERDQTLFLGLVLSE